MSLILDALKQAEKDRRLGQMPNLSEALEDKIVSGRRSKSRFWSAGIFLASAMVALAVLWLLTQPQRKNEILELSKTTPSVGPKQGADAVKATSLPTVHSRAERLRDKTPSQGAHSDYPPTGRESSADRQIAFQEKNTLEPQTAQERKGLVRTPTPVSYIPIPLVDELPVTIQRSLPNLEISGHVYVPDPGKRFIFINASSYRIGDRIGGPTGPALIDITQDGIVIDYGKGQARLLVGE